MIQWNDVKDYCERRLDEIKDINRQHHCPSGFVCIAAFIAYLSRLAYGTNVRTDRHDGEWFKRFIRVFMPSKYHNHDDLMYRTFRCGILHAMSFDDEIDGNRTVYLASRGGGTTGYATLAITHDMKLASLCSGSTLMKDPTTNAFVLVADVLCNDVKSAIIAMFKNVAVQKNCEEFVACQRYITGITVPCPSSPQTGNSVPIGLTRAESSTQQNGALSAS